MELWLGAATILAVAAIILLRLRSRNSSRAEPHLPRAFVAWSRDGTQVLCVEAEVVSEPAEEPRRVSPRRWVVLDATASKPLPVLWSIAASEASEKLKSEVAARGFDPAVLDLAGQVPPELEAGPGENVVLEGAAMRGRLDQRGPLARVPARAFMRSDGARAFVIPDERIIDLEPLLTLDLPAGWQRVANPVLTYRHDAFDGVLQLSLRRGAAASVIAPNQTPSEALPRLAAAYGWRVERELGGGRCAFGASAAAMCSDSAAGMHILVHLLTNGPDLVMATFVGASQLSLEQSAAIGEVIRTAR